MYSHYAGGRQTPRFTDWLREQSEPAWTNAIDHRFTQEIATDRLAQDVFIRYLVNEYSFVQTSVTVLGYAIAKAPGMEEKARLAEALRGLTTDQKEFFLKAFRALDIPTHERAPRAFDSRVLSFRDTVLRAASHGGYEETIAAMLAAEWMYVTWSKRAQEQRPVEPHHAEWIRLHVTPLFEGHVAWMRDQLDRLGPALSPYRQADVAYIFRRVLELEIGFHDAAYGD
jgi:thiaminase (transcriptional activator TenA)